MIYSNGQPAFVFDKGHDIDLTPEILAYELSLGFADQIIDECERQGISHAELAERLEVKPSTLSEKLNGQNLTLKSIASMALALDCDVEGPGLIQRDKSSRVRPEYLEETAAMFLHADAPALEASFSTNFNRKHAGIRMVAGSPSYAITHDGFSYAIGSKERKAA